jgi:hypothetical protein
MIRHSCWPRDTNCRSRLPGGDLIAAWMTIPAEIVGMARQGRPQFTTPVSMLLAGLLAMTSATSRFGGEPRDNGNPWWERDGIGPAVIESFRRYCSLLDLFQCRFHVDLRRAPVTYFRTELFREHGIADLPGLCASATKPKRGRTAEPWLQAAETRRRAFGASRTVRSKANSKVQYLAMRPSPSLATPGPS